MTRIRGDARPGDSAAAARTVLDAARARLDRVFADFDTVVVAFSGGKDSGAMLHLVLDHMRARGIRKPVHVFHMDYEGQYFATTEYVDSALSSDGDLVVPWRVCLPVAVGCAATMFDDHRLGVRVPRAHSAEPPPRSPRGGGSCMPERDPRATAHPCAAPSGGSGRWRGPGRSTPRRTPGALTSRPRAPRSDSSVRVDDLGTSSTAPVPSR